MKAVERDKSSRRYTRAWAPQLKSGRTRAIHGRKGDDGKLKLRGTSVSDEDNGHFNERVSNVAGRGEEMRLTELLRHTPAAPVEGGNKKKRKGTRNENPTTDTGCTQRTQRTPTNEQAHDSHDARANNGALTRSLAHSLKTHSNLNSTQLRTHNLTDSREERNERERERRRRGEMVADTHCGVSRASCVDVGGALVRRDAS